MTIYGYEYHHYKEWSRIIFSTTTAEEVRDGPAPLRPEDATPGLTIGWWYLRRPAGVPAGAGSPSGGVTVLPVPRQSRRRLIPERCGQLECVGLPDNHAVALDGVARRTPLIRQGWKIFPLAAAVVLVTRHSGIRQQTKQKRRLQQTARPYSAADIRSKGNRHAMLGADGGEPCASLPEAAVLLLLLQLTTPFRCRCRPLALLTADAAGGPALREGVDPPQG